MELCEGMYQITGKVVAMNYDVNRDMSHVVVMKSNGIPAMLEVYDDRLEGLIEELPDNAEMVWLFDRYCLLERILEEPVKAVEQEEGQ